MSPRTSKQFEAIRARSREKILNAAMEAFATKGYQHVSVSQIAARAGVAKGLLYNYFSSKEDMLLAIVELIMQDIFSYMGGILQEPDPEKKLEQLIRISFQLFREKREFYTTIMPILTQRGISEKVHNQLSRFLGEFVSVFEGIYGALGVANPRMEAYLLGALIDGVAWHYLFLFEADYPVDEVEAHILSHIKSIIHHT
ncbi:MAG: TetR/AcrR family transcriptional regulator [Bacteroidetes bacterium]|nr:MAG: TetR/AcrR family transcriptional regulator [Bacteroidota bacterium]